ncbi:class I SAM-dependent methyltransferase [Methylocaldum szegediense]|uniref:2-polyprenyl-6-hydroxyphenyl methylase / 3-demethylubiquinone-9 3-methyltransferase n=1 Tax=Methylocaldum szegediense TaxID=73780 RepID=A0ABM9I555_9GAMM|nr:class I SAM-dependent methyltransferase [Methylocaldum szegediense]CAI8895287.1 2-polyprenyl-6-hydroxyphenyl methylase / 3-demethylubiquinone-9 3-methyltransferase [Methylocaldum szegediense]
MMTLTLDTPALARQYEDLSDKQYEHGKLLIQALGLGLGWRVLDIGCGTGRLTEYVAGLVGKAGHVVGIDPLQTRIEIARARASTNLSFQVGRAERLDGFFDNSFDAVYLNSVFHWLSEKRQSLAEIYRVLKSGGRLGISTASKERPHELDRIVQTVLRRPPYARYPDALETPPYKVTSEELSALLEQAGFRVRTVEIRSFTDYFDSPGTVIHFSNASSFGHFLSGLPQFLRTAAIREIEFELEKYRRPEGIVLTRNVIFAVAEKK